MKAADKFTVSLVSVTFDQRIAVWNIKAESQNSANQKCVGSTLEVIHLFLYI